MSPAKLLLTEPTQKTSSVSCVINQTPPTASESYQANKNKIIIKVKSVEEMPFGDEPNQDSQEGNGQTEPDNNVQEGAQIVLGDSKASQGGEHERRDLNNSLIARRKSLRRI